jgi:hypothetical protein
VARPPSHEYIEQGKAAAHWYPRFVQAPKAFNMSMLPNVHAQFTYVFRMERLFRQTAFAGWALQRRRNVFPVRYGLNVDILFRPYLTFSPYLTGNGLNVRYGLNVDTLFRRT